MKLKWILLLGLCTFSAGSLAETKNTIVKIKYRKHTELDFSSASVRGKIKTPAVFYIFQRKRSQGHELNIGPENFNYHHPAIVADTEKLLK